MADVLISVIVPLYNAEKYVGECLDSLLAQTFQDFEVIMVDDCSTDNGVAIVKDYDKKFSGRLTLTKTEKNSGGGGLPRNKGLQISNGEYIQFLDADDMLTETALEELYDLAKEYYADVVCCEKFYEVNPDGTDSKTRSYQRGSFVSKPTFEPEDLNKRVQGIINERYLTVPWNKLVRRSLIIDNELFFPNLKTSEDNIWTQGLLFNAKKFLRVPNIVNIYRQTEGSSQRAERTPQQVINFYLNPVLLGLKTLDDLMSKHEFFKTTPDCRFALLKKFVTTRFYWIKKSAQVLKGDAVFYSAIREEFGERLGGSDVLISALCAAIYDEEVSSAIAPAMNNENKPLDSDAETLLKFKRYFSARLDIKLLTTNHRDFRIISVSDDRAEIRKPEWFNRDGVGYIIQSYVGSLELVFDVKEGGFVVLDLKGLFYPNPKDKTKGIPHWVDYTKFAVNDDVIFDEPTPICHDAPYNYKFEAKAGDKIKISVEWLPHRSDT